MSQRRLLLPLAHYRRQLNPLSLPWQRERVKRWQAGIAGLFVPLLSVTGTSSASICRVPFHNDKNLRADAQDRYLQQKDECGGRDPFLMPPFHCFPEMGVNSMAAESICSLGPVCGSIAFYVIWSLLYISGGQYRHRNKVKRDLIDSFSVCGSETITHLGMAGILNRWALNIWEESPIGFKAIPDLSPRVHWLIAFLVSAAPGIYACSDMGEVRVNLGSGHHARSVERRERDDVFVACLNGSKWKPFSLLSW